MNSVNKFELSNEKLKYLEEVINYWKLLSLLDVKTIESDENKKIFSAKDWGDKLDEDIDHNFKYQFILGNLSIEDLEKIGEFRNKNSTKKLNFKNYNKMDSKKTYLFSFSIDSFIVDKEIVWSIENQDWNFSCSTFFLYYWGKNEKLTLENIEKEKNDFNELLNNEFDEFMKCEKFTYGKIKHFLNQFVYKYFPKEYNIASEKVQWYVKKVERENEDSKNDEDSKINNFHHYERYWNSELDFYAKELEMVKNNINKSEKVINLILSEAKDKTESVYENNELLVKYSDISKKTFAKWPSNFKPSFMQDYTNNLLNEQWENVISLSGPPGTGKTTLIKDIASNLIYKKALKMIEIDKENLPIDEIANNLSDFGLVVASNSNEAGENISFELPFLNLNDNFPKNELDKKLNLFDLNNNENYLENNSDIKDIYFNKLAKLIFAHNKSKKEPFGAISYAYSNSERRKKLKIAINNYVNDDDYKKLKDDVNFEYSKEKLIKLKTQLNDLLDFLSWISSSLKKISFAEKINKKIYKICEKINKLKQKNKKHLKINKLMKKVDFKLENSSHTRRNFKNKIISSLKTLYIKESKANNIDDSLFFDFEKLKSSDQKIKYFKENYKHTNWITEYIDSLRVEIFHRSLQVMKHFILKHKLIEKINDIFQKRSHLKGRELIILNIIFPIISTTFASVRKNYAFSDKGDLWTESNFIGNIIIDESSQAKIYQSLGLIFRSKNALILGDTKQLEPIGEEDEKILKTIWDSNWNNSYNNPFFNPYSNNSLQEYANKISKFFSYKEIGEKLGLYLNVHRRCPESIFSIFNELFYNNSLIYGIEKHNSVNYTNKFINVVGSSNSHKKHFIEKEAEVAWKEIEKIIKTDKNNLDYSKLNNICVISYFKEVIEGLRNYFEQKSDNNINRWIKNNVKTISSFQGRESDFIIIVLGLDSKSEKAENTVKLLAGTPNLFNVAISRAKKNLIIIGNKQTWTYKNELKQNYLLKIIDKLENQ
ncbi:DEAD/DEAH box helicase [Mesomycoplasma lagogenitalium]|uniref:AAA domain-containing protein n=1 Tax=Mesomycoplasma lagogenitalium TaxID=171286 RepID=A0ABY8LW84_9BACT|nr:AAA domain-containing protein [Mesomycoplasma lagogenitalium]WGI36808.1 AAA domain-containing protein [Mesomycoplasma lagogenitalium]